MIYCVIAVIISHLRAVSHDQYNMYDTMLLWIGGKPCCKDMYVCQAAWFFNIKWYDILYTVKCRCRPYSVEYTGSHLNSEVNQRKARVVLGWGTPRELLRVLTAFISSKSINLITHTFSIFLQLHEFCNYVIWGISYLASEWLIPYCRSRAMSHITSIAQTNVACKIYDIFENASSCVVYIQSSSCYQAERICMNHGLRHTI